MPRAAAVIWRQKRVNKILNMICTSVMILSVGGTAVIAAEKKAATESSSDVTVITSEKLTFDYLKQYAYFEKDVVVVDPQMKIYADTMMVIFSDDNKAKSIKAEGNVIIIQDDKRARAAVAEYKVDVGEITLTGEPMVTSGRNILTAEVIKFWRDDNRMECKPRSRLVIYPDDDSGGPDAIFGAPKK